MECCKVSYMYTQHGHIHGLLTNGFTLHICNVVMCTLNLSTAYPCKIVYIIEAKYSQYSIYYS